MNSKKLFYGWYIVAACTILTALSMGVVSSLAVFLGPMAKANAFTKPQVSLLVTMYFLGGVIGSLLLGKLVQKSNIKIVVLIAGLLQAALTAAMAFTNSLTLLYAISLAIGVVVIAVSALPQPILINNWFKAKKNTAVGTTVAGIGLAGLIFGPVLNMVIAKSSYQTGFLVWAAMIVALTLMATFVIYTRPEEKGLQAYGLNPGDPAIEEAKKAGGLGRNLTMNEAVKTGTFWFITLFLVCSAVPQMFAVVNGPSYMKAVNVAPETVSMILMFGGICSMIGKIIVGALFDKLGMKKAIAIAFVIGFPSVGSLVLGQSNPAFFWLYSLTMGAGLNFNLIAIQGFTSTFFGAKNYGQIYSKLYMLFSLCSAGLGFVSAILIEKSGYQNTFVVSGVFLAIAVIAAFAAMAAKKPWLQEAGINIDEKNK